MKKNVEAEKSKHEHNNSKKVLRNICVANEVNKFGLKSILEIDPKLESSPPKKSDLSPTKMIETPTKSSVFKIHLQRTPSLHNITNQENTSNFKKGHAESNKNISP